MQREGQVVHLARNIADLSTEFANVGEREGGSPFHDGGDQMRYGSSRVDRCEPPPQSLRSRHISACWARRFRR